MHYHQNHCWCSKSNWTDDVFYARYMVSIEQFPDFEIGQTLKEQVIPKDWKNLVYEEDIVHEEYFEAHKKMFAGKEHYTDESIREFSTRSCPFLKQEVIDWLNDNVAPSTREKDQPQGWCMGNDQYRIREEFRLTIWFARKNDAMKFIKTWSEHKEPTTYCNYFKDDRRKLINGKLVPIT